LAQNQMPQRAASDLQLPNRLDQYTAPHFGSSALVTIDVQRDTLDGKPLEVPGTTAMLPRLRERLDVYRRARLPILHAVRIYLDNGSNVDLCRRQRIVSGGRLLAVDSEGVQLAEALFETAPPARQQLAAAPPLPAGRNGGVGVLQTSMECVLWHDARALAARSRSDHHGSGGVPFPKLPANDDLRSEPA
jgi:hypothetical protein